MRTRVDGITVGNVADHISMSLWFLFAVPKVKITGDHDMYVKTGSTVTLRCVIEQSLEVPFYVFWYHEGLRVMTYEASNLAIETKRADGTTDTVSKLVIQNARKDDEGNYTCSPSNTDSASVQLHVLNGKKQRFPFYLFK